MAPLQLEIITPDCVLLNKTVDYVSAPGAEGEFGVLAQHVPMLAALGIGDLHYTEKGESHHVAVCGGFAEVLGNKITILTEAAELAENIDTDRARQAKERAEHRLDHPAPDEHVDEARARAALSRAVTRLYVAEKQ